MARGNVFLKDDLLKAVDTEAEQAGMSRSAFLQAALLRHLDIRRREREQAEAQRRMDEACKRMDALAEKLGEWDLVLDYQGISGCPLQWGATLRSEAGGEKAKVIQASQSRYILDASVAAKWFTRQDEPDRDKALAFRELHRTRRCRLTLPEFGLLEVLNAVRFSRRTREADTAEALGVPSDLQLQIEPLDWDLLRKATAIAWAYGVVLYDAAYVALAERLGYPFLTADEALLKKMKGHSIVLRLRDMEMP